MVHFKSVAPPTSLVVIFSFLLTGQTPPPGWQNILVLISHCFEAAGPGTVQALEEAELTTTTTT